MNKTAIFARLTKIDEAARTVTGIMASTAIDYADESFDYETSKPYIEAWSNGISKATNGGSVGNVRVMHGMTVAGKLTDILFKDASQEIEVTANIVDDNEWNKVLKNCYTGFSIGGDYINKWTDANGVKKYTANVSEVSLVDLPCNPEALFTVIKSNGAKEMSKFGKRIPEKIDFHKLAKAASVSLDGLWLRTQKPAHVVTACALIKRQHVAEVHKAVQAAHGMAAMIDKKPVTKSLYDVGCLVETLQRLDSDAYWIADGYADGDPVPEALRGAIALVGQAVIDATADEVADLLAQSGIAMDATGEPVVEEAPSVSVADAVAGAAAAVADVDTAEADTAVKSADEAAVIAEESSEEVEKVEGEEAETEEETEDEEAQKSAAINALLSKALGLTKAQSEKLARVLAKADDGEEKEKEVADDDAEGDDKKTDDEDADAKEDDEAEKSAKITMRKALGVPGDYRGSLAKFTVNKLASLTKTIGQLNTAHALVKSERNELRESLTKIKAELATANETITKFNKSPNDTRAPKLFAFEKGLPVSTGGAEGLPDGIKPVHDDHGEVNTVASLIKGAHNSGGRPLVK